MCSPERVSNQPEVTQQISLSHPPTGRDQKGRRGSDEVVPGTSVVPSCETGMSRHF